MDKEPQNKQKQRANKLVNKNKEKANRKKTEEWKSKKHVGKS